MTKNNHLDWNNLHFLLLIISIAVSFMFVCEWMSSDMLVADEFKGSTINTEKIYTLIVL
jgi:hypothetical protein